MVTGDDDQGESKQEPRGNVGRVKLHIVGSVSHPGEEPVLERPRVPVFEVSKKRIRVTHVVLAVCALVLIVTPFFFLRPIENFIKVSWEAIHPSPITPVMRAVLVADHAESSAGVDKAQQTGQREVPVEFHIAAGDSAESLVTYGMQSGRQVLFAYASVHGRVTKPLYEKALPLVALRDLLDGTGLMFIEIRPGIAVVTPSTAPRPGERVGRDNKPSGSGGGREAPVASRNSRTRPGPGGHP